MGVAGAVGVADVADAGGVEDQTVGCEGLGRTGARRGHPYVGVPQDVLPGDAAC